MKKILLMIFVGMLLISLASAGFGYNNRDLVYIRTLNDTLDPLWSGNYTNMLSVCPAGNYTYGIDNDGTLKCRDDAGAGSDTNETTRFNVLVGTDCGGTDKVVGVDANGLLVCDTDEDDDTTYSDLSEFNDDILWTTTFNDTGDTRWLSGETTWLANYSNFLTVSAWNDSGLIQDWNATSLIIDWNATGWIKDQSGDSSDATWLANWTAYNTTWSIDKETTWKLNYSDFLTVSAWNDSGLIQDWNATSLIIDWNATGWIKDQSGSSSDATWLANWTAYNTTWSTDTTYSQGTNMSFDGTTINWDGSWVLNVFAKIIDLLEYIKWADIWSQVYNETEVDAINTSMDNRVINTNATMKDYVNSEDTRFNDSILAYVDSQDTDFNNSIKAYVDGEFLPLSGGTMTGNLTIGTNSFLNQTGGARIYHNGTGWLIIG